MRGSYACPGSLARAIRGSLSNPVAAISFCGLRARRSLRHPNSRQALHRTGFSLNARPVPCGWL
jgi:hypothetical protein